MNPGCTARSPAEPGATQATSLILSLSCDPAAAPPTTGSQPRRPCGPVGRDRQPRARGRDRRWTSDTSCSGRPSGRAAPDWNRWAGRRPSLSTPLHRAGSPPSPIDKPSRPPRELGRDTAGMTLWPVLAGAFLLGLGVANAVSVRRYSRRHIAGENRLTWPRTVLLSRTPDGTWWKLRLRSRRWARRIPQTGAMLRPTAASASRAAAGARPIWR